MKKHPQSARTLAAKADRKRKALKELGQAAPVDKKAPKAPKKAAKKAAKKTNKKK